MPVRSSRIEIDLDAIRKNTLYIQGKQKPGTKLLVPVKANAYGHGAVPCARVFSQLGASHFGVAIAEEGAELREGGIREPILVFGHTFADNYDLLFDYDLTPNVFSLAQAEELDERARRRNRKLAVHLSVDTGLSREGFGLGEAPEKIKAVCRLPNLVVEGIFSQLAMGDFWPDNGYCRVQFERFTALCAGLGAAGIRIPLRHFCDSGATLLYPDMHLDMVRPGTSLYGMYCGEDFHALPGIEAYPAMSVKSRLAFVRSVPEGTPAGYACAWTAARDSVLGLVPYGFADGVSRIASNRGFALLHGRRCPIVGLISMDQMIIDMTEIENPAVGDEVVLAGAQGGESISLAEAGAFAGTTDVEFACRQGARVPRIYVNGGLGKYEQAFRSRLQG